MFLRANHRVKSGKPHRYFSVVENRRTGDGKIVQRQVLYLGEINDPQERAWRKSLAVFDEEKACDATLALFPDDRPLPPDALDAIGVKLSEMELRRARTFGDCWLGCELWRQLQLDAFWAEKFKDNRGDVPF